jgi:hypothetical protein
MIATIILLCTVSIWGASKMEGRGAFFAASELRGHHG